MHKKGANKIHFVLEDTDVMHLIFEQEHRHKLLFNFDIPAMPLEKDIVQDFYYFSPTMIFYGEEDEMRE